MCEVSEWYIVWVPISVLTISKLDGVSVCNYMYVRKAFLDSLSFRRIKHSKSGTSCVTDNLTQNKFHFILNKNSTTIEMIL